MAKRAVACEYARLRVLAGRQDGVAEPSGPEIARLRALVARQRRELDAARSGAAARSVIDVATGMLMEQLHCSPAQARRQLDSLAGESGETVADLAAQIAGQRAPDGTAEAPDPAVGRLSLAWAAAGAAHGDTEIEKYFDMSVVLIPAGQALRGIGTSITSMETVGALMAARAEIPA